MTGWRSLLHGIRALLHPAAADRQIDEEVRHYLEEGAAALEAGGLSPAEARRRMRAECGEAGAIREQVRGAGWENALSSLASDLRYALRRLRREKGFTLVSAVTLAIGIGATTAVFSAIDPVLLEPLPYPHADRLMAVVEAHQNGSTSDGTFALFRDFQTRARSFEHIAVARAWRPTMTGTTEPERLEGQRVSADYFRVLGIEPAIGRDFTVEDDRPRGAALVIISDDCWRRRFAADPAVIGRQIRLDDSPFTIIGVLPPRFENVIAPAASVWMPLQYDPSLPAGGREWGHHLRTIARLRPGATVRGASAEVNALGREFIAARKPETYDPDSLFAVARLQDQIDHDVRPVLLAIIGAVALVLLIACVNVANLILARGVQRRPEFALRAALGAGWRRIARQLLTENLVLAGLGGGGGLGLAILGVRALVALSPPGLPRAAAIHVDARMLTVGLGLTALIGIVFGLIPSIQAGRFDLQRAMSRGSNRTAGGGGRVRSALVVAQVALALVLLVSSGLLMRSLHQLFVVPVGFDSTSLLTMQVQLVGRRFAQDPVARRFYHDALEAVRAVPGVQSAGYTSQLPLSGDRDEYGAHFEASRGWPDETYGVYRYVVSPGYIETLQVPLTRGRRLDDRDTASAPGAAMISASLASARFHGADPIGQHFLIGRDKTFTIVGVVGDVKQASLAATDANAVYLTEEQSWFTDPVVSIVARAHGDASLLAPAVRAAVWSVDKDQPVVRIATMAQLLDRSEASRRFALTVFEAFALAGLILAAVGIYGVLAWSVGARTREIGVRAALGATRGAVVRLVLRQGLLLTGTGILIGLAGAAFASRVLLTLLFGVSRLDPLTYACVVGLLGLVAALACWVPAARAARVDPSITLRAE